MTISTTTARTDYPGTATTGPFPFPFKVFAASDLEVVKRTVASGAEATLAALTDYTVSGVGNPSGTITLTVALALTEQLTIRRAQSATQPYDFRNQGSYFGAAHEDAMDRLAATDAQQQDAIDRSLKLKRSLNPSGRSVDLEPTAGYAIVGDGVGFTTAVIDRTGVALPGAGRTTATLSAYLAANAVFNVLDYVGVGFVLGVTDSIPAIQATFDACAAAGGGSVRLPEGNWFLGNGTITVANGGTKSIHLVGDGMFGSRLMKGTTATGPVLAWNCTGVPCSIRDLGITAALGGNPNVDGLVTTDAVNLMNGCFFERIWFNGLRNGAVLRGSDLYISHCLSELCTGEGFEFDRNVNAHCCTSYQNAAYGFVVKDTSGVVAYPPQSAQLVGCRSIEDAAAGLYILGRSNVEVTGFQCQSSNGNPGTGRATGAAILIETSTGIHINGGNIGNVGRGIQCAGVCSDVTINGAIIKQCTDATAGSGYGIQLNSSCSDISITDVRISKTYRSAIHQAAAVRVKIHGGKLADFGQGGVANDNYGVLLNGDTALKGADVDQVDFNSATGRPIGWLAGAVGVFAVRRCTFLGAAGLPDFTNAPAGTIVEGNPAENFGTAAPGSGFHMAGTFRWNTSGAAGGPLGWLCTASGTPGTWLTVGVLGESRATALADIGALVTTETATAAYTATEQAMLNHIKTDLATIRTEINTLLANRRTAGEQA